MFGLLLTGSLSGAAEQPTVAPDATTPAADPHARDLVAAMMDAAANRPYDEVADFLGHLDSDRAPALVPALHRAAAARPVGDLAQLLALLRPRNRGAAEEILRIAVLTRQVGDVAEPASLLAAESGSGIRTALPEAAARRPIPDMVQLARLLCPVTGAFGAAPVLPSSDSVSASSTGGAGERDREPVVTGADASGVAGGAARRPVGGRTSRVWRWRTRPIPRAEPST
ncbi:hypothetical protein [Kitasatospora sp. NPDC007106]|uniref:hypothetical protein n=1 Tax=Kitasatospora sp. NPDC007106 TaxID=3156914 RepID=UPI0033DA62B6